MSILQHMEKGIVKSAVLHSEWMGGGEEEIMIPMIIKTDKDCWKGWRIDRFYLSGIQNNETFSLLRYGSR